MLADVVDKDYKQGEFFETLHYAKSDVLMEIIDKVNMDIGKNNLFFASQGIQRDWSVKRGLLDIFPDGMNCL